MLKSTLLALTVLTVPAVAIAQNPAPQARGTGRMLQRVDTNGDGAISRDEFLSRATRRFERMDVNRDGKIDQTERQQVAEKMRAWRSGHGHHTPSVPAPRS